MTRPRIEGYAIVSEDGMLADSSGTMPPALIINADQTFFERGLDAADAVVHGRLSQENLRRSAERRRLIVTRSVPALVADARNPQALLWNPAGASFEQACHKLGIDTGVIAIIGGTDIFGLFLPRYDAFHLSRVQGVRLPGGRPVFPHVPERSPEEILAGYGLAPGPLRVLDPAAGASLVTWERKHRSAR